MRTKDNGKNGTAENTGKKKHAAFTWFKRVTVVFCAVVMYFAVTIGVRGYDMSVSYTHLTLPTTERV